MAALRRRGAARAAPPGLVPAAKRTRWPIEDSLLKERGPVLTPPPPLASAPPPPPLLPGA
jgi:hypothetical protein